MQISSVIFIEYLSFQQTETEWWMLALDIGNIVRYTIIVESIWISDLNIEKCQPIGHNSTQVGTNGFQELIELKILSNHTKMLYAKFS